jgi:hypothetical protein
MRLYWFALLLPALAGCFIPIPYGYPTWSQTRPVFLTKEEDTVHAFRLDMKVDGSCVDLRCGNDCLWSEIGRWPLGVIPGQTKVGTAYGFYWNCIALTYSKHVHRRVVVRLYRPGFETVELTFWNGAKPMAWKPAASIEEQERAVDELLAFESGLLIAEQQAEDWSFLLIPPGSRSREHRETLLFAAGEFERLSRTRCAAETLRRLLDKADWLRRHADE